MKRKLAALTLFATIGLTLAACSDDSDGGKSSDTGSSSSQSAPFNDADVTFAQQMIPHHEQAIEMAKVAETRAGTDEVKSLAADIEAAQGPEIETLEGWLESWGEDVPSGEMDHGDMNHGSSDEGGMAGMMDEEDMKSLEDASGAEFDRMFLQMMIEHHEGAVAMAETEVQDGENADAIAMAQKVISDQQAEIDQMNGLLGS
ncbi:DUF305 domain-containing protein [Aeromicrobium sp. 179-A 4D2 NHS]|uniref:DUF305 domain-containing protein n=1 Tax=Aeromicrobium sp. 179-A 4D2 NHS TaxID=3142375 RepID=UPI0039A3241B